MSKSFKQKTPKGTNAKSADQISDPRFANIQTDPRFRLPSKKHTHVQIDKRFAHMLRDEEFSSRAKVDRYGRKLPKGAGRQELKKFYRIADEDAKSTDGEDDGNDEDDDEIERELRRVNGEDDISSSSDSSSSDEESLDEEEEEEVFGMLEEQGTGIPKGEVTSRLAVVNLDWDNIRAVDIMAVFSSFVPSHGRIQKISIIPSEFGRERMEREEMEGPPKELFERKNTSKTAENREGSEDDDEEEEEEDEEEIDGGDDDEEIKKSLLKEDEGHEFNSAKLRRYQLERLRYFYSVITCSSSSVAQAIYDAVDGTEYLTTANFFDLRYIPDDTDFSEDKPRDECERIPDGYRPNDFVTDALQHSKVRLTWDADDGRRKEAQKRAFSGSRADIDENDLKAYLGSDSSEDEEPETIVVDATSSIPGATTEVTASEGQIPKLSKKETERQRMRALLGLQSEPPLRQSKSEKTAPVGDMEVTFTSLTSNPKANSVFENSPDNRNETTVEKYARKEKERKARRKEKMKSARSDQADPANPPNDNPGNKRAELDEEQEGDASPDLGFSDPFFTAPSASSHQTASELKAAKRQKRNERAAEEAAAGAKRAELELLMMDEDSTNVQTYGAGIKQGKHFDMPTLLRAEKALGKKAKGKKRKLSERDKQALEAKAADSFKIDAQDERFKDLYEKAEYAIDPTHPRFVETEGMKELFGERKKRNRDVEDEGEGNMTENVGRKKVKVGMKEEKGKGKEVEDVRSLVERVKGRAKIESS